MQQLKQQLKAEARSLGFHDMRTASADDDGPAADRLTIFLTQGRHGDMAWMEHHAERRKNIKTLWPDAKTALLFSFPYTPDTDPLDALTKKSRATISVYAQGKDYHDIIKPKLKQLARLLQSESGADVKVFVDTAPLMEKPLAQRAGLGWQGKHTNLVSRNGGSWFFIGTILTTAQLPIDEAEQDHCGQCTRCLDVCPTKAFPKPYQLDARRCISYLTIEHKGPIAHDLRRGMGNRIYGCDDCLAVCPWNKFAVSARDHRLAANAETGNPPLIELLQLDDAAFRNRFRGTPIKRTGRDRFLRNVVIAAGNSKDRGLIPHVAALLDDHSALVRGAAIWAMSELEGQCQLQRFYDQKGHLEKDPDVNSEWNAVQKKSA